MKTDLLTLFYVFAGLFVLSIVFNVASPVGMNYSNQLMNNQNGMSSLAGNAVLSSTDVGDSFTTGADLTICNQGSSCTTNNDCSANPKANPSFAGSCSSFLKYSCDCTPNVFCGALTDPDSFLKHNYYVVESIGLTQTYLDNILKPLPTQPPATKNFYTEDPNILAGLVDNLVNFDSPQLLLFNRNTLDQETVNAYISNAKKEAEKELNTKIEEAKKAGDTDSETLYQNRLANLNIVGFAVTGKISTVDAANSCCTSILFDQHVLNTYLSELHIQTIVQVGDDSSIENALSATRLPTLTYPTVADFAKAFSDSKFSYAQGATLVINANDISVKELDKAITSIKDQQVKNYKTANFFERHRLDFFAICSNEDTIPPTINVKDYTFFSEGDALKIPFSVTDNDKVDSVSLTDTTRFILSQEKSTYYILEAPGSNLDRNTLLSLTITATDVSGNKAEKTIYFYLESKGIDVFKADGNKWYMSFADAQNSLSNKAFKANVNNLEVVKKIALLISSVNQRSSGSSSSSSSSVKKSKDSSLSTKSGDSSTLGGLISPNPSRTSRTMIQSLPFLSEGEHALFVDSMSLYFVNSKTGVVTNIDLEGYVAASAVLFNNAFVVLEYKETTDLSSKSTTTTLNDVRLVDYTLDGKKVTSKPLALDKPSSLALSVFNDKNLLYLTKGSAYMANPFSDSDSSEFSLGASFETLALASDNTNAFFLSSNNANAFATNTFKDPSGSELATKLAQPSTNFEVVGNKMAYVSSKGQLCTLDVTTTQELCSKEALTNDKGSFSGAFSPIWVGGSFLVSTKDHILFSLDNDLNVLSSTTVPGYVVAQSIVVEPNYIIVPTIKEENATTNTTQVNTSKVNTSEKSTPIVSSPDGSREAGLGGLDTKASLNSVRSSSIRYVQKLLVYDSNLHLVKEIPLGESTTKPSDMRLISVGSTIYYYDSASREIKVIEEVAPKIKPHPSPSKKKIYYKTTRQDCIPGSRTSIDLEDAEGNALSGGKVFFDGKRDFIKKANVYGNVRVKLVPGNYLVTLSKRGYKDTHFSLTIDNCPIYVTVDTGSNRTNSSGNTSTKSSGTDDVTTGDDATSEDTTTADTTTDDVTTDTTTSDERTTGGSGNTDATQQQSGATSESNMAGGNLDENNGGVHNIDSSTDRTLQVKSLTSRFSWFIFLVALLVILGIYAEERHRKIAASAEVNLLRKPTFPTKPVKHSTVNLKGKTFRNPRTTKTTKAKTNAKRANAETTTKAKTKTTGKTKTTVNAKSTGKTKTAGKATSTGKPKVMTTSKVTRKNASTRASKKRTTANAKTKRK